MRHRPPLVIAAHGTRDAEGEADAHRFVDRVRAALPDVDVRVGFVELSSPLIADVTRQVAREQPRGPIVVLPLMLASGGHAKDDIPAAIEAGAQENPHVLWRYARVLGPHDALVAALRTRVDAVLRDGSDRDGGESVEPNQVTVLLVGRGSSDVDSTANVAGTARRLMEAGGYASVETCFIAVATPGIEEGLARVARLVGARGRVVVAPYVLFQGLMRTDIRRRVEAWCAENPEALGRVDIAETLGADDTVVDLAVARYREATVTRSHPSRAAEPSAAMTPYPVGLLLAGRRVVVVGGGCVAQRRVDGLLEAGADVVVVAPQLAPRLAEYAAAGRVRHEQRGYRPSDLNDAWYVLACADDPAVNAAVGQAAAERRIFCVRSDDGRAGSAWTPAVGRAGELTVAVLGARHPKRARRVRDLVMSGVEDGTIDIDQEPAP